MFACIGKRKGQHGRPEACTNTSETPSNPARPDWGYLCPPCLGTQYGRPSYHVDLPDLDKPNSDDDFEPGEVEYFGRGENEQEEIERLEEVDLM